MVLTVINIIALVLLAVGYFRGNYTIVDLETWNKLAHFYNEYSDGEGGLEVPEQAGGCGFSENIQMNLKKNLMKKTNN